MDVEYRFVSPNPRRKPAVAYHFSIEINGYYGPCLNNNSRISANHIIKYKKKKICTYILYMKSCFEFHSHDDSERSLVNIFI